MWLKRRIFDKNYFDEKFFYRNQEVIRAIGKILLKLEIRFKDQNVIQHQIHPKNIGVIFFSF